MNTKADNNTQAKINILHDMGYKLDEDCIIVDFGCGGGAAVKAFRDLGYNSFGCDFEFKEEKDVDTEILKEQNLIRLIQLQPYRLPFDDGSVDCIFSDQVFEHVQNYSESIAELKRILKPSGYCLHMFPSRYIPVEPHLHIPLATVINSRAWLSFWAKMGIRNEHQEGMVASDTVDRNYDFLKNHTNYLSKAQIRKHFNEHFKEVVFCEKTFLKFSERGRYVYLLSAALPFLPSFYSTFRSRVVLASQPLET